MDADVLVVGGGPAGLATAIAARSGNLRVTLIDARNPPIDKPCGEGLLPQAVIALRSLGIRLDHSGGVAFTGLRFADETCSAVANIEKNSAFALRRTALHRLLVDRALEVGVDCLWGTRISRFSSDRVTVNGRTISCKWLVGADGPNSAVRQFAGLGPGRHPSSRFAFRRHYEIRPWTDLVEVHWGRKCQVVVTPTGTNEICISLFSSDPRLRLANALGQFPEVAERVREACPVSSEQGAATALHRARAVVRGNIALVGDAACTVDGIAGQGLSLAFQQSLHLAQALASGDLAPYESAYRRIVRTPTCITRLLLCMDASVALRHKVLRLFARRTALFSKMISIHVEEHAPSALKTCDILSLGWRVLWP
jgi:2-polyprenyl-6-methoxyphenol hydroxylase-like FAD-dependent oxidoreductase